MKYWIYFFKAPRRVLVISKKRQVYQLKRQLIMVKHALAQEKQETKEMLAIYKKYTQGRASKREDRKSVV